MPGAIGAQRLAGRRFLLLVSADDTPRADASRIDGARSIDSSPWKER